MAVKLSRTFKTVLLTLGFAFLSLEATAAVRTVKTNRSDVFLWHEAGRGAQGAIETVQQFEEVQVMNSKTLESGEKWYYVQVRRFDKGRPVEKLGWVNAKFFTDIEDDTEDDQIMIPQAPPSAGVSCLDCEKGAKSAPVAKKQVQDLSQFAKAITPKPVLANKTEFIWPATGQLRSRFGYRYHPIKRTRSFHRGIDIARNNGAPVHAVKAGVIRTSRAGCVAGRLGCNGGAGNFIEIDHGNGLVTQYMHLNPKCRLPRVGTRVSQGSVIACVGNTGRSTGPHLHFGMIKNGSYVNPLSYLPKKKK